MFLHLGLRRGEALILPADAINVGIDRHRLLIGIRAPTAWL